MTTLEQAGPAVLNPPIRPTTPPRQPLDSDESVWIPASAHTLAGFRKWNDSDEFPERGRISFFGGEIYIDISQERISTHVALKGALARWLITLAEELQTGQYYTDGVRLVNVKADLSNEPDGCFLSWAGATEGRFYLQKSADGKDMTEVVGSPDMVVEIVSPSSTRKDLVVLKSRYHAAGIPEYWLIDARGDDVAFTILHSQPEGFVSSTTADGWQSSSLFSKQFRFERSRNPLGIWTYRLESRPSVVNE
jgi:Uma2 family endonuclease